MIVIGFGVFCLDIMLVKMRSSAKFGEDTVVEFSLTCCQIFQKKKKLLIAHKLLVLAGVTVVQPEGIRDILRQITQKNLPKKSSNSPQQNLSHHTQVTKN
jgi:hypothetical protein